MWQAFVHWFSNVINFMYGLTVQFGVPSYGLAIILMTIAIKLVLFPLTQKQLKSMSAMQEIQPKAKWIQEKYKDDPQVMQKKVMELYKEHGVNPMGGCLPLLVQMPIFIAFYRSLLDFNFVEVAHARFLWIPNIGQPDPYYLLAILAALTTFLQQKVAMVDTKDPTQKSMLYFMPIFMAWIAIKLPAGLPLYWVVFNILGILQQLYVNQSRKAAKLATGTGLTIEVNESEQDSADKEESVSEKAARRGKGGKENNAGADSRKKGKKR